MIIHLGKICPCDSFWQRNHAAHEAHLGVLVIDSCSRGCIEKASAYCIVDKYSTKCIRGCVLRSIKHLTTSVAQSVESIKHVIKDPDRSPLRNSAICAVLMSWLEQFVSQIIDKPKTAYVLKREDGANVNSTV